MIEVCQGLDVSPVLQKYSYMMLLQIIDQEMMNKSLHMGQYHQDGNLVPTCVPILSVKTVLHFLQILHFYLYLYLVATLGPPKSNTITFVDRFTCGDKSLLH